MVTLTGHAQAGRRSDGGKIVCLDAHNGSKREVKNLNGVVEARPTKSFSRTRKPLIVDGLVVVAARKVSPQLLTSATLSLLISLVETFAGRASPRAAACAGQAARSAR